MVRYMGFTPRNGTGDLDVVCLCISPGQHSAFRGSTGVLRQCFGAPGWLEQRYNGPGKYRLGVV